mmetsp:Transcript_9857/g.14671  ORF Transcript_9857/g.14671 Transcript_9857/m.14671 type:complete len:550 (-) Transcript_9857:50-1699(-)
MTTMKALLCTTTLLLSTNYYHYCHAFNAAAAARGKSLIVISPAGGVGEATAINAAKRGAFVKWFVLQQDSTESDNKSKSKSKSSSQIAISEDVYSSIQSVGGSVELAGSSVESILDGGSIGAVGTWVASSGADALICSSDNCNDNNNSNDNSSGDNEGAEVNNYAIQNEKVYQAVCMAAKEASNVLGNACVKVAVISQSEREEKQKEEGSSAAFLKGLFGNDVDCPANLCEALGSNSLVLKHGDLFGVPGAPPFVGGPRRDPILREEYVLRSVRLDPAFKFGPKDSARSSRLAVGEAAALMAMGICSESSKSNEAAKLFVTSLRGEALTDEEWSAEVERAMDSSSATGILFETEFASVPSLKRLTDWVATKWFPAILKTYEIATIKTGARPVYASSPEEGKVEILWQKLEDFKSVNVGKLVIDITETGMTARRQMIELGGGRSLQGENVFVRRLADAAAQAIEKGLAVKPIVVVPVIEEVPVVPEPVVSTTVASAGTVVKEDDSAGPRGAGARRSSERSRGAKRRKEPSSPEEKPSASSGEESSSSTWQ